jgi:hypothetical protein
VGIFLLFVIGLWNTKNIGYGIKDLQIKLPLLLIPIILFLGPHFTKDKVLRVFGFLAFGAVISAMVGYINFLFITETTTDDFRAMSPFISHIRLSLMLCFSLTFFYYLLLTVNSNLKWLLVIPTLFALFYLSEVQSLTALVILPIVLLVTLLFFPPWKQSKVLGRVIGSAFLLIVLVLFYKINDVYQDEFQTKELPASLPEYNINGNKFHHDISNPVMENGNFVGLYYCKEELEQEWTKVSLIQIDSIVNGYPLRACLERFLASKGLTKDSLGISKLSEMEVKAIERGVANYRFLERKGIETRIHTTLWEIKKWRDGWSDYESSVTMRLFIWGTAKSLIKENLWTGVGTGDVEDTLKKEYAKTFDVNPSKVKRTHNQYLSVAIATGFIGLMVFVFLFIYPFAFYQGAYKYLYTIIGVILFCSMLWEDTIETQAGVALFGLLTYLPFAQYLREKESSTAT